MVIRPRTSNKLLKTREFHVNYLDHSQLVQKLRGHYGYYGIIGNFYSLLEFREGARKIWRRKLSRRRRDGDVPWTEFLRLEKRYSLPRARVVHGLRSSVAKS
jgi:RNA-directed DNA polymerase